MKCTPLLRATFHPCRLRAALSLTVTLPLLFWSIPCIASIQIADSSPHAAIIRRVYSQLPAVWKTDTTIVVREMSDDAMDRFISATAGPQSKQSDDSVVDGCYVSGGGRRHDPPTITLRSSLHAGDTALVFSHEYGHYVWDYILKPAQRKQYRQIWSASRRDGNLVTDYASESVEEGFAESVAYYEQHPDRLRRRDTGSWQFLQSIAPQTRQQDRTQPQSDDNYIDGA